MIEVQTFKYKDYNLVMYSLDSASKWGANTRVVGNVPDKGEFYLDLFVASEFLEHAIGGLDHIGNEWETAYKRHYTSRS